MEGDQTIVDVDHKPTEVQAAGIKQLGDTVAPTLSETLPTETANAEQVTADIGKKPDADQPMEAVEAVSNDDGERDAASSTEPMMLEAANVEEKSDADLPTSLSDPMDEEKDVTAVAEQPGAGQPMEVEPSTVDADQTPTQEDTAKPQTTEPTQMATSHSAEPANGLAKSAKETTNLAYKPAEEPSVSSPKPEEPASPPKTEEPVFSNAPGSWQIPLPPLQPPPEPKVNPKREILWQKVEQFPEDVDSWLKLLAELKKSGDVPAAREAFEKFLKLYPTSPKQWLDYLEMECNNRNFVELEALYKRCLPTVLSIDVWINYLVYIRQTNSIDKETPEERAKARKTIKDAYGYFFKNVGIDKEAGKIWLEFIDFLKSQEVVHEYEKQHLDAEIREAFKTAVSSPVYNLETIWKNYDKWEYSIDKIRAKDLIGKTSSIYMTARSAMHELTKIWSKLAMPKAPRTRTWTQQDVQQLLMWKKYIRWEKSNPLSLDTSVEIMRRVDYVYQQALIALRFYPEIWFDYSNYYKDMRKIDRALSILKTATEAMPTSLLVHFAYAELCETEKKNTEAQDAFDSILKNLDLEAAKIEKVAKEEVATLNQKAEEERAKITVRDEDMNRDLREERRKRDAKLKKDIQAVEEQTEAQVNAISKQCSLVWIANIRFARRTKGIKSARTVFLRARKAAHKTYHVFIASALMEYHNTKDSTIAGKIFELAEKAHPEDPDFVSQYLDYLAQMNDDKNTRALYERVLTKWPVERTEAIWQKYLDYENKYGDLSNIYTVERRRSEAIHGISPLDQFTNRYGYQNLNTIKEYELGGEERRQLEIQEAVNVDTLTILEDKKPKESTKQSGTTLAYAYSDRYPAADMSRWRPYKPKTGDKDSASAPVHTHVEQKRLPPQPKLSAWQVFASQLPPPYSCNVPNVDVDLLIDILTGRMDMPVMPPHSMPHNPPMPMRNRGPSGKGPRNRGRGKDHKRHRDDYEDDSSRLMGPGPNRPPDDFYRNRHGMRGKRHRNEPY